MRQTFAGFIYNRGLFRDGDKITTTCYKYFIRELVLKEKKKKKNVASLNFSFSRVSYIRRMKRRVILSLVRKYIVILGHLSLAQFAFAELCQNFRRATNARFRENMWITGSRAHS